MNEKLEELKQRYAVSPEKEDRIFKKLLRSALSDIKPSNDPVAVIVGGQPGCGKTQVLQLAQKEFNNNIVICNADSYRKLHPQAETILQLHENLYPDITTGFAQSLNIRLRNECKTKGINFALEITMRDGKGANSTIEAIKKSGYTCNVDLLAVNEKWSRLGTVERLEAERSMGRFGRVVSTAAHDERYKAMPQAVQEISEKHLYDNIRVFCRAIVSINDRPEQRILLVSKNPANPLQALNNERNRPMTTQEIKYFNSEIGRVAHLMESRSAPAKEITEFKNSFSLTFQHKNRGPKL